MIIKDRSIEKLFIMENNQDRLIDNSNFTLNVSTSLNFSLLADHIKRVSENSKGVKSSFAGAIISEFEKTPELHGKIYDINIIKNHEELINNMMMFVFPESFWEKQTYAAFVPYSNDIVFSTKKFRELNFKWDDPAGELNVDSESFSTGKSISVFSLLLKYFYNVNVNFDFPIIYKLADPETGLDLYYKMNSAAEFVEIIPKKEIKKLSPEDIDRIKANFYDLELVSSILEPENFEFNGLLAITAVNISDTEILSSISKDLIEKDTITSLRGFLKLQHKIKSLLKCPGLLLGFMIYPGDKDKLAGKARKLAIVF